MIVLLVLLVATPAGFSRRKRKLAGKVDGQTYLDAKYDFRVQLPEDWKYKVGDADENFRLYLVQKNYEVPPDYLDAEDYTLVPKIVVWVDTTTLGPAAFIDSLVSESFDSDQKGEILKEFELINQGSSGSGTYRDPLGPRGRKIFEIGEYKAFRWAAKCTYMKEVALSASDTGGGKRVRGAYEGTIAAVKYGNVIVLFHLMSESQYYDGLDAILMQTVQSISFPETNEEESEG
jgi:hypothetical protein